jgi:RNA polymerase sigma factor (sigma-70 family)
MPADNQAFVATLAREHGSRLHRFLTSRLRQAPSDVADLVQEVYLRLLRAPQHESVRNPQAYMFTVAFNVLHQHKRALAGAPEPVDLQSHPEEFDSTRADNDPASELADLNQLECVLRHLPRNVYVSFVLHRSFGFTVQEIARQLGVSNATVKKYLARSLVHCRSRVDGFK